MSIKIYCYVTADSNVRPETVGLSFGKVGTVNEYLLATGTETSLIC